MQLPASDSTGVRNGLFGEASLLLIEETRVLGHSSLRLELPDRVGRLKALSA
jgi:hypothetical protein